MGIGGPALNTNQFRGQGGGTVVGAKGIGAYFSPVPGANPEFMVLASAIIQPANAFVPGTPIIWEILAPVTDHASSFFTGAVGDPSERLKVNFPRVKLVYNVTVTPDENFSQNSVQVGPSVGLDNFTMPASQPVSMGMRLTGNGTNTWVKNGINQSRFDFSPFINTDGRTYFNAFPYWGIDYDSVGVQYVGPNNYHVLREYTSLQSYNAVFILIDNATGLPVLTNPTAADEVYITNAGMINPLVLLATWQAGNNEFMQTFCNFWVLGLFEAWMVAAALGAGSIQVKWQSTGADSYKILRDTAANFPAPVEIFDGTGLTVTDTGLAAGTLYYYKMVVVNGGIETDWTTFTARTTN